MGQGAEDAMAAYEMIEAHGTDPEAFYGTGRGKRKRIVRFERESAKVANAAKPTKGGDIVHRPANDDEAKALIAQLDHYEWDTHKITGKFDRNPYTLTAKIDGQKHKIKLTGRFGGVLRWLDARERELAGVA